MARSQTELSELLHKNLGNKIHYYFQPPETIKMKFPCVVYEISSGNTRYADNGLYAYMNRYTLSYITPNSEDPINDLIRCLPLCRFDRRYSQNNLYHNVYDLYF